MPPSNSQKRLTRARPARRAARKATARLEGTTVARVSAVDAGGTVWVLLDGQEAPAIVATATPVSQQDVGRRAVLRSGGGETEAPVLVALVREPHESPSPPAAIAVSSQDGRVILTLSRGVEVRCGKALVTLDPDGTIRVRGTNVVTSATGLNRIRGASVKIN